MNVAIGFGIVLGALGSLMGGLQLAQRLRPLAAELSRKAVHVGMGVTCLALPWLFAEPWPVWTICGLALAALAAVRWQSSLRAKFGGVLCGVQRQSWGELYFPVGVALVFTLAKGDWLKFCVPVAVLTFADTAGALVGQRFGKHPVKTFDGTKSVEGCAAVFVVATACAFFPLWLTNRLPLESALLAALVIGLMAMFAEAASWQGLDNLILPLAVFAQLVVYEGLGTEALAWRLGVFVALAVAVFWYKRRTNLDEGGLITTVIGAYLAWVIGGWQWLLAPAAVFFTYLRLVPAHAPVKRNVHSLPAVMSVGVGCFVWMIAQLVSPDDLWLLPYTAGLAAHLAMIAREEFAEAYPDWSRRRVFALALGVAGLGVIAPFFLVSPEMRDELVFVAGPMLLSVLLVLLGQCRFEATKLGAPGPARLVGRAALGFLGSVLAVGVIYVLFMAPVRV